MGIDLTTLLAGLTGGAQGMGVAVTQEDARARQQAADAERRQMQAAQMANLADEQKGRELTRYTQGFRQGTAPDQQGLLSALKLAGDMTPGVGAAPSMASLAIQQAASSDPRFAADRYQQVNQGTYVDQTATPEAVESRQMALKAALTPRPAVTPPRIDPLSPQGIDAQRRLEAYKAGLKPQGGADGQAGAAGGGSDGERQAANFAARMLTADVGLGVEELAGKPTRTTESLGRVPFVGGAVLDAHQQKYRQLQQDWVRAKLRKESGATIGDQEMQSEIDTYFPTPNDSPELVAQKAQRRKFAAQLMQQSAGRAWTPQMDELVKVESAKFATPRQTPVMAPSTRAPLPPRGKSGDTGNVDLRPPLSDADYWEQLVNAGKSPDEATAIVRARKH